MSIVQCDKADIAGRSSARPGSIAILGSFYRCLAAQSISAIVVVLYSTSDVWRQSSHPSQLYIALCLWMLREA